jgi:hypothetical protein
MKRIGFLMACSWIGLWPALGQGQDRRYDAVEIHNNTNLTIHYRVRWGEADWQKEVTLKPNTFWSHWWIPETPSPKLLIRFDTGIDRLRSAQEYLLDKFATLDKMKGGNPYHFEKRTDAKGEAYVDLFTGSGKTAPPAANLAGSTWSGSETLAGYGTLSFRFLNEGRVNMIDKDGDTPGTWRLDNKTVTMQFGRNVTYTATAEGNALRGSAGNGKTTGTFAVSPTNAATNPFALALQGKGLIRQGEDQRLRLVKEVAYRQEALKTLRSFTLGNTISSNQLDQLNQLPADEEPLYVRQYPLPQPIQSLIAMEKKRHGMLEFEMVAAVDRFLRAAKLSPAARQEAGIQLYWLYGPVSSVYRRDNSRDQLGGMRMIGQMILPDGREMFAIVPMTFYRGEEGGRGVPGILWGADNFRIEVQLYATGKVKADYAHQSFSIGLSENNAWKMQPGLNIDERTGMLVDRDIKQSALGTSCIGCHSKGPNIKRDTRDYRPGYQQMKAKDYRKMEGFEGFLQLATHEGATKAERAELADLMAREPTLLFPIDELLRANEEQWVRRYPEYKIRTTEK